MNTAYVLLGSNMGKRESFLSQAIKQISINIGKVVAKSSLYETAPWGNSDQNNFINQVISIETNLTAENLLFELLEIEKKLGRTRNKKWEARTIDIDILFFNLQIIKSPNLQIPHPHLHERKFTLIPLVEIAASLVHPVLKKNIKQLLLECKDNLFVTPISSV